MPVVPTTLTGTPAAPAESFQSNLECYLGLPDPLPEEMQCQLELAQKIAEDALNNFLQTHLNYKLHTELAPIGEWFLDEELVEYPTDITGSGYGGLGISYDSVDTATLRLRNVPVHATGLDIYLDYDANGAQASDPFPESTKLVAGVDYYLDVDNPTSLTSKTGIVHLLKGSWPRTPRTVRINYYAGYTDLPYALQEATFLTIAHVYTRMTTASRVINGGGAAAAKALSSESVPDYSWSATGASASFGSVASSAIPAGVTMMLMPYKRYIYVD